MRKLTLVVEDLSVESFEPLSSQQGLRGTVRGALRNTGNDFCGGNTEYEAGTLCGPGSCYLSGCNTCGGTCERSCWAEVSCGGTCADSCHGSCAETCPDTCADSCGCV